MQMLQGVTAPLQSAAFTGLPVLPSGGHLGPIGHRRMRRGQESGDSLLSRAGALLEQRLGQASRRAEMRTPLWFSSSGLPDKSAAVMPWLAGSTFPRHRTNRRNLKDGNAILGPHSQPLASRFIEGNLTTEPCTCIRGSNQRSH